MPAGATEGWCSVSGCPYCRDHGTLATGAACPACDAGRAVRYWEIGFNTVGVLALLGVVLWACGSEVGWW